MHVASRPIPGPIALIERPYTVGDERRCLRILVFRDGLLNKSVITLLGKMLAHV